MRRVLFIFLILLIGCADDSSFSPSGDQCHNDSECSPGQECRFEVIEQVIGTCVDRISCETNKDCLDDRHCNDAGTEQYCGYSSIPFQFVDEAIPEGYEGEGYYTQIKIFGNTRTYSFQLQGTLPRGIVFSENGTIVGIPQEKGEFPLIITAINGPDTPDTYYYNTPSISRKITLKIHSGNRCESVDCSDTPNSYCDGGSCVCNPGYHPEEGVCLQNTRSTQCGNELPEHARWSTENSDGMLQQQWDPHVKEYLPDENSCDWECAPGYFKDGSGYCIDQDPCLAIHCDGAYERCEGGACICNDGYHRENNFCVLDIRSIPCGNNLPENARWDLPYYQGRLNQLWYPSSNSYLPEETECSWSCLPGFISTGETCIFTGCPAYMEQSGNSCICPVGYSGDRCDQCSDDAELIDGSCIPECPNNLIWKDGSCRCPKGMMIVNTKLCINPCLQERCIKGEKCVFDQTGKTNCICDEDNGYQLNNDKCSFTGICTPDYLEQNQEGELIPVQPGKYTDLTLLKKDCSSGIDRYSISLYPGERLKVELQSSGPDIDIRLLHQETVLVQTSSPGDHEQINYPFISDEELPTTFIIEVFSPNQKQLGYEMTISQTGIFTTREYSPGETSNTATEITLNETVTATLNSRGDLTPSCGISGGRAGYYHFTLTDEDRIQITIDQNQSVGFALYNTDSMNELGCHHQAIYNRYQGNYLLPPGKYLLVVHQLNPVSKKSLPYQLTLRSLKRYNLSGCPRYHSYFEDQYGNFQCSCNHDRGYFLINNQCTPMNQFECPDNSMPLVQGRTKQFCHCIPPYQPVPSPWGKYSAPFYNFKFNHCQQPLHIQEQSTCSEPVNLSDNQLYLSEFTPESIDHEATCNISGGGEHFYHFSLSSPHYLYTTLFNPDFPEIVMALESQNSDCTDRININCYAEETYQLLTKDTLLQPGSYNIIVDQGSGITEQILFSRQLGKGCTQHHCNNPGEICVATGPNTLDYYCSCDQGYQSDGTGCVSPCSDLICDQPLSCYIDENNTPYCACPAGELLYNNSCIRPGEEGGDHCKSEPAVEITSSGIWSGSTLHNSNHFSFNCGETAYQTGADLVYHLTLTREQQIEISLTGETPHIFTLQKGCDATISPLYCSTDDETITPPLPPGTYSLIIKAIDLPGSYTLHINFLE